VTEVIAPGENLRSIVDVDGAELVGISVAVNVDHNSVLVEVLADVLAFLPGTFVRGDGHSVANLEVAEEPANRRLPGEMVVLKLLTTADTDCADHVSEGQDAMAARSGHVGRVAS
jgi:hypothetical protein